MNQADKIITAVIIVVAFICMFSLTKEYYPKIAKYSKTIESCRKSIKHYEKQPREKSTSWTYNTIFGRDGQITNYKKELARYEKKRNPKIAIVVFGNIGIIIIAAVFRYFLVAAHKPTHRR